MQEKGPLDRWKGLCSLGALTSPEAWPRHTGDCMDQVCEYEPRAALYEQARGKQFDDDVKICNRMSAQLHTGTASGLTTLQTTLVTRLGTLPRTSVGGWLEWHIACTRHAAQLLRRCSMQKWGGGRLSDHLHFLGHVSRLPECHLARRVLHWRCIDWWRDVQARIRQGSAERHRRRGVQPWVTERQAEAAVRHAHATGLHGDDGRPIETHSCWEAATDRSLWKRLVRSFVTDGGALV